jgi:tetratricopeptide (TPR) repeat protein
MKYSKIFSALLVLAIAFSRASFGGEVQEDPLGKARRLVEQRYYSAALEIYDGMNAQLSQDPDLLIEWARVYTYVDRHPQAIAIFERVRKEYPVKEKEILRELGDQYKWNGELKRSIEIYRKGLELDPGNLQIEIGLAQALAWDKRRKEAVQTYDRALAADPNNINALLGKAEVLSWDDKLEKARKVYEEILKKDPQNVDALNGIARICVWQGYHRLGIKRYLQILKDHPGNPEAMEGIAFAYHWDGQEALALKAAEKLMSEHPDRHAGKDLYGDIRNIKKPHVLQGNRFSDDANHLYIAAEKAHVGTYVGDSTIIGGAYEWYLYRQPGKVPLNGNRGGFDISHRLNEYLEATSYLYLAKYSAAGFTPFTTNTWLTFKPNDILRIDGGYDRETFEDITSMNQKIIANSGSISFDLKPNRFWLFSSKYKRSHYSDGNNQNTIFSKAEYRLWQKPYLKLFYNFYYSDWADQMNNGYFNPKSIYSNTGGIYGSTNLWKKLFWENQLSMGYEIQNPKQSRPTYYASTGFNYSLPRGVGLFTRAEYFLAKDTDPGKRYSKGTIWFGLTYSLGGEPGKQHEAQQAQRPLV